MVIQINRDSVELFRDGSVDSADALNMTGVTITKEGQRLIRYSETCATWVKSIYPWQGIIRIYLNANI